jgi:hypothetical protein
MESTPIPQQAEDGQEPKKPQGRRRSRNEEINDSLTIESMLQVKDNRTGKQADVRAMLGIHNKDIQDQQLKEVMSNYSLATSQKVAGGGDDGATVENMGDYLKGLDFVEFDTGKFEDDPVDPSLTKKKMA